MNTIRDTGFVLKEGARLLTELKRLHDRLQRSDVNLSQATQAGLSQIQLSRESTAAAVPPPLPAGGSIPTELDHPQVAHDSLMEAFAAEKPDALGAYTGLAATNPATGFLAGEIISINYHNAMAGEDFRPEVTGKAIECFNQALTGDLGAGLEFLKVKHRGQEANHEIVKECGRAVGKEIKGLSERNAEILRKKTGEFLSGKSTASRFRAEIARMGNPMSQKM